MFYVHVIIQMRAAACCTGTHTASECAVTHLQYVYRPSTDHSNATKEFLVRLSGCCYACLHECCAWLWLVCCLQDGAAMRGLHGLDQQALLAKYEAAYDRAKEGSYAEGVTGPLQVSCHNMLCTANTALPVTMHNPRVAQHGGQEWSHSMHPWSH